MKKLKTVLAAIRFYSSVVILNVATLLFMMYLFLPTAYDRLYAYAFPVQQAAVIQNTSLPTVVPLPAKVVSGTPTRIEIINPANGMHTDLPVTSGYFDTAKKAWTLNNTSAFYATPSVPANDTRGTTLIYGHASPEVFGYLNSLKSGVGAYALVHTDTGKTFRYSYDTAKNLSPDDTSVFTGDGAPTLVVQTCTGDWFQYRRMYHFSYQEVTS